MTYQFIFDIREVWEVPSISDDHLMEDGYKNKIGILGIPTKKRGQRWMDIY